MKSAVDAFSAQQERMGLWELALKWSRELKVPSDALWDQLASAAINGKLDDANGRGLHLQKRATFGALYSSDLLSFPDPIAFCRISREVEEHLILGGVFQEDWWSFVTVHREAVIEFATQTKVSPPSWWAKEAGPRASVSVETACRKWLADQMRERLTADPFGKPHWRREASLRFDGIGTRAFDRAWQLAKTDTGAEWGSPGRKPVKL